MLPELTLGTDEFAIVDLREHGIERMLDRSAYVLEVDSIDAKAVLV